MKIDPLAGAAPPITSQMRDAIAQALPGANVRVTAGQPGHFSVSVRAAQFQNQTRLACQRMVYKAIAHLMSGERAPVHAIDQLETGPLESAAS
jgi:acid stress-induced BolA-like protein IbaG/YrbA